jgi:hypothetical protein
MLARFLLITVLVVTALLAGCATGAEPTPVPELADATAVPEAVTPEDAYPAPGYPEPPAPQADDAYPGVDIQAMQQATREALPTLAPLGDPAPGKGNLMGQIERESDIRPREPLAGWTLLLAEVHRDVSGQISPIASIIEGMAPSTVTDRDGRYAFADIEPGLYALVIRHPLNMVLARDIRTEQDVVIEIIAGETVVEPLTVVTVSD